MNLVDDEIHRTFVFVTQGLARYRDEESMVSVFLVPSVIPQFFHVKRLVDEEPF